MGASAIDVGRATARAGDSPVSEPPRSWEPEEIQQVVDPTSRLLREVERVESRFPWTAIAVAALGFLWLGSMPLLRNEPLRPAEIGWIQEAIRPADGSPGTSATWAWRGIEIERGEPLTPNERLGVRLPAAAAGAASLLMYFILGRLVAGGAAALLAACLLAIAPAWIRAGTSALPLLVGEMMVLFGVTWALLLHGRHREGEIAAPSSLRIGVAGAFLGIGLLLAPAMFASFATMLLLWFVLGLRRSSSEATTLPVQRPARTVGIAVIGTFVIVGAAVLAAQIAERLAGASGRAVPDLSALAPDATIWLDLHRRLLSPGPRTDVVLLVALALIAISRGVERWGGRPWKRVGLLPWIYLAVHVSVAGSEARAPGGSAMEIPFTVAPLLVLGLGWTILRGLQPGRVRRQEYGFALTWLSTSVLVAPFIGVGHPHDPILAASVSLLPPGLLIAARGARALWEAADGALARAAVIAVAYFPVVIFILATATMLAGAPLPLDRATAWMTRWTPWILVAVAAAGALSQGLTIRPERMVEPAEPAHHRGRRGRRGGRGGRGGRHGPPGRRRRESGSRP